MSKDQPNHSRLEAVQPAVMHHVLTAESRLQRLDPDGACITSRAEADMAVLWGGVEPLQMVFSCVQERQMCFPEGHDDDDGGGGTGRQVCGQFGF